MPNALANSRHMDAIKESEDSVVFLTAGRALLSTERVVRANMTAGSQTVTLASPAACRGVIMSILNLGSNTFTLALPSGQESVVALNGFLVANADPAQAATQALHTITGSGDFAQYSYAILYCDGLSWFCLATNVITE